MELKELLGDDLYKQVQAKIDEKNSTETDKLKHVRYTDLSEGKYVSKDKYDSELDKLNTLITGKDTEIGNANKLIEELKKASKTESEPTGWTVSVNNNAAYCGIGAGGVQFANGKAEITSKRMADWFTEHDGYTVIPKK